MNELTRAANRAVLGSARIQLQSAAHLAKRDGSALVSVPMSPAEIGAVLGDMASRRVERAMIAADIGCRERTCQAGTGDPPMDCGWPDCGCGLIIVVRPPTYPSSPRLSPDGTYFICDQCGREWQPGTAPGCEPCAKAFDERDRLAGVRPC